MKIPRLILVLALVLGLGLSAQAQNSTLVAGVAGQIATTNNIMPDGQKFPLTPVALDAQAFRSFAIQINPTGTVSGGTIVFECSNDNVNFAPLSVFDLSTVGGAAVTSYTPATATVRFFGGPTTMRYIRARISSGITGGGSVQAITNLMQTPFSNLATASGGSVSTTITSLIPGTGATNLGKAEDVAAATGDTGVAAWGIRRDNLILAQTNAAGDYSELATNKYGAEYMQDYEKATPTYSTVVAVTAAASATDIFILPGNATNTVWVTRVEVSGAATATGIWQVLISKRSTANSGGTSTAATAVAHDSGDVAASSLPLSYSANPAGLGTLVGAVAGGWITMSATTGASQVITVFDFGQRGKGIKLSGVAQGLAVNLNAQTIAGAVIFIRVEWREEP